MSSDQRKRVFAETANSARSGNSGLGWLLRFIPVSRYRYDLARSERDHYISNFNSAMETIGVLGRENKRLREGRPVPPDRREPPDPFDVISLGPG